MPCLIELKNITFGYPGAMPVLDELNFDFDTDATGLVGDNGSGKTTLLHLIMGLINPQSGEMLFRGKPLTTDADWLELRKTVGFVFQNPDDQLFMPTVIEDVTFGPLNLGHSQATAKEMALQTLETLGLGNFADRLTHKLSGGEKRLVAMATVLSMQPEALILDEPTNDLDQDTRHRLIHILRDLPQHLLIVSHDWDFLDHVVDRLAVLDEGKISYRDFSVLHVHKHAHLAGDADHHHE
ncbi:MAG: energy-coupling factor ABC transporter ATP-binding protein [Proteobacteria bacterium]|nr:energy-coupling factor ABC transporter ATP-binding protein [Pseudomonadota bacterium]